MQVAAGNVLSTLLAVAEPVCFDAEVVVGVMAVHKILPVSVLIFCNRAYLLNQEVMTVVVQGFQVVLCSEISLLPFVEKLHGHNNLKRISGAY